MFKFVGAAAVVAAAYGIDGGVEVTAVMLASFATLFYAMAFRLFTGLSQAELVEDVDLLRMTTIYMIYLTSMVVVFKSDYYYIAIWSLPWLTIQTVINILSVLIKLDVIGIKRK